MENDTTDYGQNQIASSNVQYANFPFFHTMFSMPMFSKQLSLTLYIPNREAFFVHTCYNANFEGLPMGSITK